jgi:trans-2,3-dihydro-3-hydroxyanthranilate isomerase
MPDATYTIVDVFTDTAFGGNPLAMFADAPDLTTAQMQVIAREMNLSETTFVTPGSGEGRFRVRIFTPAEELPFAGHPTVGTAIVLAAQGLTGDRREIVLEEGVGPVRVELGAASATFFRDGAPEERPCEATAESVAAALGIPVAEMAGAPWQASYGTFVLFVPLADRAAVASCALRRDLFASLGLVARGVYVFAVTARQPGEAALHARFFAPGLGVGEDPATGSAAASLAGSIKGLAAEGRLRMRITQGVEMGRPSLIETETFTRDGAVSGISIGGGAVIVGEGRLLRLP